MNPPRLAEWLVLTAARPADRDALRDDLAEEYGRRVSSDGRVAASRWYRRQALRSVGPLLLSRAGRSPRPPRAFRAAAWREAARSVIRHPRISIVCVVTVAVASGAALAAGTIVHTVALRELPFPGGERIVALWNVGPELPADVRGASFQDLEDWRTRSTTLEAVSGETAETFTLTERGEPRRIGAARVARDFERVLGVTAHVGRLFDARDFHAGGHFVAVLTHGFWLREFAGSRAAVGQTLILNDRSYEIVGILPPTPTSVPPEPHEFWVPMIARPGVFWENSRGTAWLNAVGRLKPGITPRAARDELSAVAAALASQYPESNGKRVAMEVRPLRDEMALTARRPLVLLAAAVGGVLLVAWANLINLLMTHATTRRPEFAVRLAIGADRRLVAGQIFAECVMLAGAGVAIGVAVAPALIEAFVAVYPGALWRAGELHLDAGSIAAAVALGLAGAALLAIPQARYLANPGLSAEIRQGARITSSRRERHARLALVAAQVAFCVVLLTGGVVFSRTLAALGAVDPGFDPAGILVFEVTPSRARFGSASRATEFFRQVRDGLQALPGVRRAAAATAVPFTTLSGWRFSLGPNALPGSERTLVEVVIASPEYFETLGIPIVEGRPFAAAEHERGGPPVVMVNEALARLLNPARRRNATIDYDGLKQIVGIVGNARDRLREPAAPQLYMPWHLAGLRPQGVVVKADGDPLALLPSVLQRIHSIDPAAPVSNVARLRDLVHRSLAPQRFRATMLAALAGIAVVLAVLGVYSVTAFTLAVQDRENGIRRALGEPSGTAVVRLLGVAVAPAATGALAGAAVAAAVAPSLEALLYGASARDPAVIAAVSAVLLMVSGLAGAVPARAAMRVDPAGVLRTN